MRLLSPHFPAGRIGAGLLLLRLSAAVAILATPEITAAEALRSIGMLVATALILGFWTRAAAILGLGLSCIALKHGADLTESGAHMLVAGAIVLLGPGAYSADAAMFGRRTIILRRGRD